MFLARAAAVAALIASLPAQEAPLRFVDGRPVLLVTLRAGEASYPCHLLVDLARREPLFLHDNAARSLGALACDVTVDGSELRFEGLSVQGERDRWLEGFTAQHAEALREVPVAGYLGLGAFGGGTLVLDGPGETIALRSAAAGFEQPPASADRGVADLAGAPDKRGVVVALSLGAAERSEVFALDTKNAASRIAPRVARELGAPTGRVGPARLGSLDLARVTPFRPERPEGPTAGTLGGAALARLKTTIALGGGWIACEAPADIAFPEDEAAFYDALFGGDTQRALAGFLEAHPDSAFRSEAARARLELVVESGAAQDEVVTTASAAIEAAAEKARAREALTILDALPTDAGWAGARRAIAEAGLEFAKDDEDGNANHRLRLELGRLARRAGEAKEARRHLLAAAFGMRGDGPTNLELGALYEEQGELERALSRYLIVLLDMEDSGEAGLLALERVHAKLHGSADGLAASLAEMAEGRIPALHPIPREPEAIAPTGRVLLAELFTGAMCPPCAAADVAFDALGEYYGADEVVLLQWHVPIPAPEPLVAEVSLDRLKQKRVRGTPTAIFGGRQTVSGGGKADQAGNLFAKYVDALTPLLAEAPVATLHGEAKVEGGALQLSASAALLGEADGGLRLHAVLTEDTLIFPGSNGILFHHHVARARLTPVDGVPLSQCGAERPFVTQLRLDDVAQDLDLVVASLESRGPFRIRPTEPSPAALGVVLFLEDPASGAVVQALALDAVPGS